ncbi:MAG: tryptophan 7-halogenase [Myxococcales bacterium]|nr:tryptophan 7-halogenase [Myxococcales bacterium]MCB9542608.1 tryptophan 7-halogenase [Myxococcales bacterium]
MKIEKRDCVVIGGGPAGSTFAAIVAKYAPDVSVTLLERAHHPRYHIGESTIPVINGVFHELELFDTLYDGRFVRKMGVTFVWGADRQPWDADYLEIEKYESDGAQVINVVGQDFSELMRREMRRDIPLTSINVRRAEFDHLLIQQAAKFGAEVREGVEATAIHYDADGAVAGVSWRDEAGAEGRIEAPFVLDASGLRAMLTRGKRVYDAGLANFAVNGYLRGADWKVLFRGRQDASTVFIVTVPQGWIWYIPVAPDIMSVGAVTNTAHFKDRLREVDLETFFWEMVRQAPEIAPLIANAALRDDVIPGGKRVTAHRDWSGWAESPIGPGFAAAGDAAIFIDPVLSSGVTLAVQSGHRAAYTFMTARERPAERDALWRAYADYIRGEAGSYLQLARFYYGNNRAAESWWWQAQRLVNQSGRLDLSDRSAFTMATAGFFPHPRAISVEIMAPLIRGLTGAEADLFNIYHDDGVGELDGLLDAEIRVRTPFRLALRAEADPKVCPGRLSTFHDLVADDFAFAHRYAAAPCKIAPSLGPVVEAIPRFSRVADLVEAAPGLLPPGFAPAADIRRSTLVILRNAAKKGFVELVA